MKSKPRILFCAKQANIEPLGLFYLAEIARQEGWEPFITMVESEPLFLQKLYDIKPDIVGFTVYTGWQKEAAHLAAISRLNNPEPRVIIGGPYATCFPNHFPDIFDHVVVGDGLQALRQILRGDVLPRIIQSNIHEPLPLPYRKQFYKDNPKFADSPIKSIIANQGCPYACSYCYNSMGKKLFPLRLRPVAHVNREVNALLELSPKTKLLYFQDDVFAPTKKWMKEFGKQWEGKVPFHCQLRVEGINDEKARKLADLKCTGITMAIESGNEVVRREVLNRDMSNDVIFAAVGNLAANGLRIRTEQMLGLPTGNTSVRVPVGIEADLETLKMNVRLRAEFGQPVMVWASILQPYYGTKMYDYCKEHGYYDGDNDDLPGTFFERSRLRFRKEWNGDWMDKGELEEYSNQMQTLQRMFPLYGLIPKGDVFAEKVVGVGLANIELKNHLYNEVLYNVG